MADVTGQHRSVAILKALGRRPDYRSNELVLGDWLQQLALTGTRGGTRHALERLVTLGVIETAMSGEAGDLMLCWLTEAGLDYVERRHRLDGLPALSAFYDAY